MTADTTVEQPPVVTSLSADNKEVKDAVKVLSNYPDQIQIDTTVSDFESSSSEEESDSEESGEE